jgi:glycosyltransferase involved in cell wall biosynthesis
MGRYLTNILDVLQSEFNLIALYPNSSKFENLPSNAIKFGFSNYFLWEQISLPIFIFKNKFDIFIYPYNTCSIFFPSKAKKIIIVHDLIFFQKYKTPTFKQKIGKIYRRLITPIAIKTADKIITVSEFSRMIIKKKFTDKNIAVTVIPNTFKINQINCNIDYKSRKNYFLTISGESGHKNIERLIESFSIFN